MRPEKNLSALFGIPAEENLLADFPGFFGKSVRCRCHIFITGKFFCFQCHGHIKEKSKEKAIPWSSVLNVAKKSSARIVLHPISIVTSDNVEVGFLRMRLLNNVQVVVVSCDDFCLALFLVPSVGIYKYVHIFEWIY